MLTLYNTKCHYHSHISANLQILHWVLHPRLDVYWVNCPDIKCDINLDILCKNLYTWYQNNSAQVLHQFFYVSISSDDKNQKFTFCNNQNAIHVYQGSFTKFGATTRRDNDNNLISAQHYYEVTLGQQIGCPLDPHVSYSHSMFSLMEAETVGKLFRDAMHVSFFPPSSFFSPVFFKVYVSFLVMLRRPESHTPLKRVPL